ncbi:GGDEF domain-containing protein [Psychrobacillus soli]|uniref:Diguanylate cyclase n=1 Tax=Psychrobacillus soli TaxID=1543965 RepID=A0A544TD92_9BACI|nr:tetratricopeptide repeat-containing diguanylate cyclase [Psychrobacillus soli]TQR15423.1 diguanylate cyclase [Psychrobacillus soli]
MISESKTLMEKINEAKEIALKYPSEAFETASSTYKEARISKAKKEEAASLFVMALACRSMTKLESCYDYAYDAYLKYEELGDQAGIASALNLIGVVYFYNGMYEQSLENFLNARRFATEPDDDAILSRIYNNMGEVYREVGNMEEALAAYEKALYIAEKQDIKRNQAVILLNMGWVCFNQHYLDESFAYYRKSYDMLLELDDVTSLAEVENKIGKIYYLQQDYEQAKRYYMQALERLKAIGNKFYTIEVLINLAEFELRVDEDSFLNYMEEAIKNGEEIQARQYLSRIFNQLSVFYESKGQFDLALNYYKKYHLLEQVIGSTTMSHKLEIIKLELNKLFAGKEMEEIAKMNEHLKNEISTQKKIVEDLEQTNQHLSGEVFYDDLTKLANRKYFTKYLNEFWNDESNADINVALLMIDIDYFKRYNDFHGHIEGDRCLQQVGNCMKTVIEDHGGILGRFGGEEFVGFLKHISQKEFLQIAEELRKSVETMSLLYCWEQHAYPITISVGAAFGQCEQFESKDNMYAIADEELYKAKTTGRNQVKVFAK